MIIWQKVGQGKENLLFYIQFRILSTLLIGCLNNLEVLEGCLINLYRWVGGFTNSVCKTSVRRYKIQIKYLDILFL